MDIFLNWLWQGSSIALAAALALKVSRRTSATIRCYVLWLALLLILLLPLRLLPSTVPDQLMDTPGAVVTGEEPNVIPAISMGPVSPAVVLTLAGVAACWTILLVWQAALALVGLHRLKRRCQPFPPAREACLAHWNEVKNLGRHARLVISPDVSTAAVLGITSPVIAFAPALLARLSPDDLDRIAIHEWAHVQRRDDVTNLLQILARAAVGWHPGVWWIDRQLHSEREAACDERAIRVTGSPRAYAACLARLAELRGSASAALLIPGAANARQLTGRIERVLARRALPSIVTSSITGTAAIVALPALAGSLSSVSLIAMRPVAELAAVTASLGSAVSTAWKPIELADRPAAVTSSAAGRRPPLRSRPSDLSGDTVRPIVAVLQEPLTITPTSGTEPASQPPAYDVRPLPPIPESGALASLSSAPGAVLPQPTVVTDFEERREATPWGAAADTGAAVARGSQRAAVATAGFFTRLGKKVAKSF